MSDQCASMSPVVGTGIIERWQPIEAHISAHTGLHDMVDAPPAPRPQIIQPKHR